MKIRRKTNETSGRLRQVIINRPFVIPQKLCVRCIEPSGMITPDEAAVLFNVSTLVVYRWLETDSIHFCEGSGGMLLICLSSLAAAVGGTHASAKPAE